MRCVARRIADGTVLSVIREWLNAPVVERSAQGERRSTEAKDRHRGTPQGGIISPLLANIALSVLDEAIMAPWAEGGDQSTQAARAKRRYHGKANWRIVRYADDFVIMTNGSGQDAAQLKEHAAKVLATVGLTLSESKTRVAHLSEGIDFLGFHIQWKKRRGDRKWFCMVFIADKAFTKIKQTIRALTPRRSPRPLTDVINEVNAALRGWTYYFRHALAGRRFSFLRYFTWRRFVAWQREQHRWGWKGAKRWLRRPNGSWNTTTVNGGKYAAFEPPTEIIDMARRAQALFALPAGQRAERQQQHQRRHAGLGLAPGAHAVAQVAQGQIDGGGGAQNGVHGPIIGGLPRDRSQGRDGAHYTLQP